MPRPLPLARLLSPMPRPLPLARLLSAIPHPTHILCTPCRPPCPGIFSVCASDMVPADVDLVRQGGGAWEKERRKERQNYQVRPWAWVEEAGRVDGRRVPASKGSPRSWCRGGVPSAWVRQAAAAQEQQQCGGVATPAMAAARGGADRAHASSQRRAHTRRGLSPTTRTQVLLEFATNDPTQTNAFGTPERLAFERLVRKLLDFLNRCGRQEGNCGWVAWRWGEGGRGGLGSL